jgi:hypothetical protein
MNDEAVKLAQQAHDLLWDALEQSKNTTEFRQRVASIMTWLNSYGRPEVGMTQEEYVLHLKIVDD